MPLQSRAYMILITLGLSFTTAYATESRHDDCSAPLSVTTADAWVDLETALNHLDYSSPASSMDSQLALDLAGNNLDAYVQAELFILKNFYLHADRIQSAISFLHHFDDFERLHLIFEHPNAFLRQRSPSYSLSPETPNTRPSFSAIAIRNMAILAREALILNVLAMANRHPFLILRDDRVLSVLVQALFVRPRTIEAFFPFSKQKEFLRVRYRTLNSIAEEKRKLLASGFLPLSARSELALDKWKMWLRIYKNTAADKELVRTVAGQLKIDLDTLRAAYFP